MPYLEAVKSTIICTAKKMWHPASVLFLLASLHLLEHGISFASRVTVLPNRCDTTGYSGDGNGSFVDSFENCTESLTLALQNVTSHTTIILESGHHSIDQFILIQDVANFTLEAEFQLMTIQCTENSGLAFINVSQLSILNVVIDGCGFSGSDSERTVAILKTIVNIFYVIPEVVPIAMLLGHCENVVMENVTIMNTRGFGLVGINVIGSSQLNSVLFFNNSNPGTCESVYPLARFPSESIDFDSRNRLGGAAAFMYFNYCDQIMHYHENQFSLNFQNCDFSLNAECSEIVYLNYRQILGRGESRLITNIGYRLGGAGALSLVLAQLHYGIDIAVNDSNFIDNSGVRGGLIIALFTGVNNTHVTFDDCLFNESAVAFFNDVRLPIEYCAPCPPKRDIAVSLLNSTFTNAMVVGGVNNSLFIFSNYYSGVSNISEVVNVYIDGCIFVRNKALIGSALLIYERKISGLAVGMQVSIKDTDFIENEILTANQDAVVSISQSAGTVDVRNVNVTFYGNCSFIDNIGSGVRAESSIIGVSGSITFLRNNGINGGGLYLVLYSYLIMNKNSSIYFIENEARIEGGAIYVNQNGLNSHIVGGFVDCFIHFAYDNFVLCENCSDLESFGVYIQFSGNRAPAAGRMVSGSSLSTCPWAEDILWRHRDSNQSLFEILNEEYSSVFSFDEVPDNPTVVRSASARLQIDNLDSYSASNSTKVFPGQVFHVNISAIDDFENIVSNIVAAYAFSAVSDETSIMPFLSSNRFAVLDENNPTTIPIRVTGKENGSVNFIIYSTDTDGRAQEHIDIELLSCGFGFQFDVEEGICVCDPQLTQLGITCNNSQEIIVPNGIWIGPFANNLEEIVIFDCIRGYCSSGQHKITIINPDDEVDFDAQCNPEMNRAGFLCGSCRAGYSAVLGTNGCRQCSNLYLLLFPIFLAIGIIAILLITHLNVTITAGFINGAIFYSNIIIIYDSILVPGGALTNGAVVLISFPTLSLGFETCLYANMTTLEKVWWRLSFPFYLFFLMGLISFFLHKKILKVKQSTGLNTIQAFATLLVLCYVSVLEACIELVSFTKIPTITGNRYTQWLSDPSFAFIGSRHGTLGILAFLIIVIYVIPLPILLLFPSVLYKNKYLSKFKPIYDAFWDSFKPRCRFYLGLRLMFRWIPFNLAYNTNVRTPVNVFVTNLSLLLLLALQYSIQPFQNKWVNYIDTMFLLNLVLLFSGSIFFWSEYNSLLQMNRDAITLYAHIYSSFLITLGFLMMLAIIIYHIFVRFPWLLELTKKHLKKSQTLIMKICIFTKIKKTKNATINNPVPVELVNQIPHAMPAETCNVAVLREPLLESGTLVFINPSSVPVQQ